MKLYSGKSNCEAVFPSTRSAYSIIAGMPLLFSYVRPESSWENWAVILRDHMVEHNLGLTLALLESGVDTRWMRVFDKGDATLWQHGIANTFTALGVWGGLLDNTAINAPRDHSRILSEANGRLREFIRAAHADGRRVLVIDDGGLVAQGYGHPHHEVRVDAGIELTMSGLDRIAAAGELAIPILDLARSEVKQSFGYREIAHSCVVRLQALMESEKLIGQSLLVLGYGSLGSLLAHELRSTGCRIAVIDPDYLRLAVAAEEGFATYETLGAAFASAVPSIIVGTSGGHALTEEHFDLLPDNAIIAPFATKDFSVLYDSPNAHVVRRVDGWGDVFRLPSGRHCVVLGNGRSLNLFEADSISPSGYDIYKTAVYLCARQIARGEISSPGLHREIVNDISRSTGLYEEYYRTYLGTGTGRRWAPKRPELGAVSCVIGAGRGGWLHETALREQGHHVIRVDPGAHGADTWPSIAAIPAYRRDEIQTWHICTPTEAHLQSLEEVLGLCPEATIVLEKPAVPVGSLPEFRRLVEKRYPHASVVVVDQYRHSRVTAALRERVHHLVAAGGRVRRIYIEFSKDRREDERTGRFVDRDHGALGYEWTHIVSVVQQVFPELYRAYLRSEPGDRQLHATDDVDGVPVTVDEEFCGGPTVLRMCTSSVGPAQATPAWLATLCPADGGRRRICAVELDEAVLVGHFALGGPGDRHNRAEVFELVASTHEVVRHETFVDLPLQQFFAAVDAASATMIRDDIERLSLLHRTAGELVRSSRATAEAAAP